MTSTTIPTLPSVDEELLSPLARARIAYKPKIPAVLEASKTCLVPDPAPLAISPDIAALFPHLSPLATPATLTTTTQQQSNPSKFHGNVAVLFSGGQAPGGHNVVTGLFDHLQLHHPSSNLYGILHGPAGLIHNQAVLLTAESLQSYRNTGGFDLLGSSRTKVEKETELQHAVETIKALQLGLLVIVGGDDSNTNAAVLAEYLHSQNESCRVIGVPKTIDGDLKCDAIPMSFGFDSATKLYSELIGNIQTDSKSAGKYYHFVRLMGRSASHITLECALQTRPNWALIGEEVCANKTTLLDITTKLASIIKQRSELGKEYGVFLIPEGLIEFVPEVGQLITELNTLLAIDSTHTSSSTTTTTTTASAILSHLSPASQRVLASIPPSIQDQLLLDRDPHGNVQVAKIETERLIALMVEKVLAKPFNFLTHYLGYEGRCCFPSNLDANYCYALGRAAMALALQDVSGVMVSITGLANPPKLWHIAAQPLVSMMKMERRKGKSVPVIEKALVKLEGRVMREYVAKREAWALRDEYRSPGPCQFHGPLADVMNETLRLESAGEMVGGGGGKRKRG